jgi:hypothetical protein
MINVCQFKNTIKLLKKSVDKRKTKRSLLEVHDAYTDEHSV